MRPAGGSGGDRLGKKDEDWLPATGVRSDSSERAITGVSTLDVDRGLQSDEDSPSKGIFGFEVVRRGSRSQADGVLGKVTPDDPGRECSRLRVFVELTRSSMLLLVKVSSLLTVTLFGGNDDDDDPVTHDGSRILRTASVTRFRNDYSEKKKKKTKY